MKVTKLVIDRAHWGTEVLLSPDDASMCCLGFLALACGAALDEIQEEGEPDDVPNINWPAAFVKRAKRGEEYFLMNTELASRAMSVNDSGEHVGIKEKNLITIFKQAGIKLSFTGKYEKSSRHRIRK